MKPLRSLVLVVIAITATTALAVDSGVAAAATRTRTITVVGTGEVRGTPDVADLVLGVSGRGATAAEVMRTIGECAQRVIDALREAGVAEEDVQTNTLWVHPVLDDQNHVDGYEATNTVTARVRDLGTAGSVIDSAAERAGDNIVVQGITFSIDDDSELLANARTKATRRARAQAEQLASGAGVEVGDVKSISEATSSVPLAYAADAAREAASTPVEPGSATLSVSATVVFTIR